MFWFRKFDCCLRKKKRNGRLERFKILVFFGVKNLRTTENWAGDKVMETQIRMKQRYQVAFAFKEIVIFVRNVFKMIDEFTLRKLKWNNKEKENCEIFIIYYIYIHYYFFNL